MTDPDAVDSRLARHGGVSHLHIPATDPKRSAEFYAAVFGWTISGLDTSRPSFRTGPGT
jgi:predicted enzyme related to lactoylglutathione lyase